MTKIESTKCNKCISSGGGDCATCDPPGTAERQEPEFIITESELKIIPPEYWVHINRIHSRPAPNINGVIKELEQTIKCNERWGNKLEPYYRGVNAAHELTISLLMHPANQTVQQTEENPCTENGCTDIENCDEICQHSRVYSPFQMQQAIAQATEAENKRVLDEFSRAWRSGSCPNPMAPCSMDDGKIYCPICIAETLRLAQPKPTEREPE